MASQKENIEQDLIRNANQLEEMLKEEISEFQFLDKELRKEIEDINNAVGEGQKIMKLEENEIQTIREIMDFLQKIESDIKKEAQNKDKLSLEQIEKIDKSILEEEEMALKDIKELEEIENKDEQLAMDEIESFIEGVEELVRIQKLIHQEKNNLKELYREEQALEEIAKNNELGELSMKLNKLEEETHSARNQWQNLKREEEKLYQLLNDLDQEVKQHTKLGEKEIRELKKDLEELPRIIKEIKNYLEPVTEEKASNANTEISQELYKEVNSIETEIGDIKKHLKIALKIKAREIQGEEDMLSAEENRLASAE